MQLAHDAMVLVADGRKMLFLRNEGDATIPNLVVEGKRVQDNPKTSDQVTDTSSSAPGGGGSGGNTYEYTDFHQLEEDRFAAEAADILKARALRNEFKALVIVAPPGTLGELRKHYHSEVSARLVGEIDKDLTGHPVSEIEAIIAKA